MKSSTIKIAIIIIIILIVGLAVFLFLNSYLDGGTIVAGGAQPLDDETREEIDELFTECSEDTYNCGDFTTQAEAQAVFDYCFNYRIEDTLQADVHRLDNDGDGVVCESLL